MKLSATTRHDRNGPGVGPTGTLVPFWVARIIALREFALLTDLWSLQRIRFFFQAKHFIFKLQRRFPVLGTPDPTRVARQRSRAACRKLRSAVETMPRIGEPQDAGRLPSLF